jgi:UTP---glucose-1-phosphate uridylyltransferase
VRHEALEIILEGNGEFYAEGVTFRGNQRILVPDGQRMIMAANGKTRTEKIEQPTWQWHYGYDADDRIQLSKQN